MTNETPATTFRADSIGSTSGSLRVGLVVGTTRPGRKAAAVTGWAHQVMAAHPEVASGRVTMQVLDLTDVALPLLDEPVAAAFGLYAHPHTRAWAASVAACDAFVFVTPEYNHSIPAALKNAIDYLFAEWHHKPAGILSYGLVGGVRAAEHLRSILLEVKTVPVSAQVALSVFDDFTYADPDDPASPFEVTAREHQAAALLEMLDEITAYSAALSHLRTPAAAGTPAVLTEAS